MAQRWQTEAEFTPRGPDPEFVIQSAVDDFTSKLTSSLCKLKDELRGKRVRIDVVVTAEKVAPDEKV
jgi:hypothetical protein